MTTSAESKTEIQIKFKLTQIAKDRLDQRAAETGRDLETVVSELLEQSILRTEFCEALDPDEHAKTLKMLEQSFRDIQEGRTQPAKEAMEQIATEFALSLGRRPADSAGRE